MCYGPEFTATAAKGWIAGVGAKTTSSSPAALGRTDRWKASTGKLRDELLTMEVFSTLAEAKVLIER
jgi:hypothetical protein